MYSNLDLSPKMCFKCSYYGKPKVKRGKEQWKGHYFIQCAKCPSKVFFSQGAIK